MNGPVPALSPELESILNMAADRGETRAKVPAVTMDERRFLRSEGFLVWDVYVGDDASTYVTWEGAGQKSE